MSLRPNCRLHFSQNSRVRDFQSDNLRISSWSLPRKRSDDAILKGWGWLAVWYEMNTMIKGYHFGAERSTNIDITIHQGVIVRRNIKIKRNKFLEKKTEG